MIWSRWDEYGHREWHRSAEISGQAADFGIAYPRSELVLCTNHQREEKGEKVRIGRSGYPMCYGRYTLAESVDACSILVGGQKDLVVGMCSSCRRQAAAPETMDDKWL